MADRGKNARRGKGRIWLEAAVAILILGTLTAWWIRSMTVTDTATLAFTTMSGISITSRRGSIEPQISHNVPIPDPMATGAWSYRDTDPAAKTPFRRLHAHRFGGSGFGFELVIPYWLAILLTAGGFGWYFWRRASGFRNREKET